MDAGVVPRIRANYQKDSLNMISIDQQIAALSRRTERIVPEADLRAKLERSQKAGKPLRIKFGMDPTAPDITLKHAMPLKIIRQFQD